MTSSYVKANGSQFVAPKAFKDFGDFGKSPEELFSCDRFQFSCPVPGRAAARAAGIKLSASLRLGVCQQLHVGS